ncbi:DNA-3-methyladenine glycosylase I [Aquimarina sp. AD1]|uniref:DNA-3-methyladenine glycosylase I n=1 Tax=Aquimarina sp. (strain AD1) TaxID=1714848 RepID=UPI000E50F0B5|nr:DNA-3-methyladenine glycosylase I [Aquimarina sp. AD1]AXT56968.1 DNA-3-methyladenine glycosylase I [Aquimarina sp. AD1]RKN36960.1 DNA-3-methyladenine glycosylase I [Aquimarina sp. AD1]
MEKHRCGWCIGDSLYESYHDNEWGVPLHDERLLFEFLVLETFQAGLSWITILRKRENFRVAFDNFDYKIVAQYNESKKEELLQNAGIIRNKLKVNSAITNAQNFMKIQEEFGSFDSYIWGFIDSKPIVNKRNHHKECPATTEISDIISKDLKKRGFKFVGSTVIYAFMQAIGMVNDHTVDCFRYNEV